MSVVGIGSDIIEISRLAKLSDSALAKLAKRVLTPRELVIFNEKKFKLPFLAKRWAGKEAASKALGTGIAAGVSFQHFDIVSLTSGQPLLELSDVALDKAKALGASHWHISLSDEREHALAFVVLSK